MRMEGVRATKRLRRSVEEARSAILEVAERQMAEVGPAGIRLQEIAKAVGVSHPTVLHHFKSREGLIQAVISRSTEALHAELVAEIGQHATVEMPIAAMLESAAKLLGRRGHARIAAWMAMSGVPVDARSRLGLQFVAQAAHAVRNERLGESTPPFEDTYFVILLAALTLFGDAVVGHSLRRADAVSDGTEESERFRRWLAELMHTHLQRPVAP